MMSVPNIDGEPNLGPKLEFEYDFPSELWDSSWIWLRNPKMPNYFRSEHETLTTIGPNDELTKFGFPTWIGVSQVAQECKDQATVSAEFASIHDQISPHLKLDQWFGKFWKHIPPWEFTWESEWSTV